MKAWFALVLLPFTLSAAQFGYGEYQGKAYWLKVSDSNPNQYQLLSNAPFESYQTVQTVNADQVAKLPPIEKGSVYAVGLNYRSHAGDSGARKPEIFFKSYDSVVLSGDLTRPKGATNVHFEGELVVVIGRQCYQVSEAEALQCVFGYLAGNDLTERSWQGQDLQWWRAKGAKGFGPVSDWIQTAITIDKQVVTTTLNGQIMQQETVANMIHGVSDIIVHASQYIELRPGDLIFTGTPGRTRALKSGDVVSVSIDDIGSVTNTIR
ncbi:fumarylacetoacetate hydrolase family protein [Vibrio hippocampi]|uniref:Fumarylacetoacetase-like C-terminal domain-containing protein n=1 Tax=Vibrio hippocampi TaxID=654686 RepID=A0ABN8DKA1_9VIBR|nr:fumarylacetoacetate hydrolase family protein [Vibrio hippocampi]CAH0525722.1 hypothetical protein VHP8226_01252 [Vibrio hippocampi]